ncbi:MAG: hypothetical protein IMF07_09060 [Proteobacteria bacterium]|nr:hypothetical protein [Pseudomonadota bacterium]
MWRSFFTLFFLIFLTANGCATKILPVAVPGGMINERRGSLTINKGGIAVTAEAEALYRTPYNLENYFTPFRVVIRNETGRQIRISLGDFVLLDEKGNQYNAYSPEKMAEIVKSDPDYVVQPQVALLPVYPNHSSSVLFPPQGYNYAMPYYDQVRGHWSAPYDYYSRDRRFFSGETLMQDIFLTALPVGRIINGAQVFGNVYFRTDMRDVSQAMVHVTVEGVEFELPFLVK